MKNTKLILLTALVITTLFSTVIFTACTKKVTCSSIVCQHGGTCNNGSCSCPVGYSGAFCEVAATTYISYQNTTFTPITLTITNGATSTIPVGESVTISGLYGTTAVGTATTSGAASELGINTAGGAIGVPINWEINNNFPAVAADTLKQPLGVGATYYFLRMINSSAHNIVSFNVNTADTATTLLEEVTVPNNGTTYDLGYYLAYPNSNVLATASTGAATNTNIALPFTTNQTITVTVTN